MIRTRHAFAAAATALLLLAPACPTEWRLERVEGERPSIHGNLWREVNCAALEVRAAQPTSKCATAIEPKIHCADKAYAKLCRTSPDDRTREVDGRSLTSVMSFVHTSDAQLKEHRIHIAGALSEAAYDGIASGLMRNDALQRNDDAVLLATVLAANRLGATPVSGLVPPLAPPLFTIHTGDAVDAGMFSELLQFINAMDALEMPWFNVVGNHDVLFFGTFPSEIVKGLDVVVPYVPIVDVDRFMRFHSLMGLQQDPSLPAPSARGVDHEPSSAACRNADGQCQAPLPTPKTHFHGFDVACTNSAKSAANQLCAEARGYYSFKVPLAEVPGAKLGPRELKIIVLNTSEVVPEDLTEASQQLSDASVLPEQIRWLKREIAAAEATPGTFVLVFGHHDLASFQDAAQGATLLEALQRSARVLGYLAGHTHEDGFVKHARNGGPPLWEVVAGSTLVFPQLAREVELLSNASGDLYLRVVSFRQQLSDARDIPPDVSLSPPECADLAAGTSFCHRLAHRAHLGREGADKDVQDGHRRNEEQAVPGANGLMLVYRGADGGGP